MSGRYDIVIIGGGLAGATLACALASQPLKILVIEAFPPRHTQQPSFDDRSVALSAQTIELLRTWQVWANVTESQAIQRIHVSDRHRFSKVRMDAEEYPLDMLGSVVANRVLGPALWGCLEALDNVHILCPAKVLNVEISSECATVDLQHDGVESSVTASLVVGAEGQQSIVRGVIGAELRQTKYDQVGIITNVETELAHKGCAYERFTAQGPLAMLPLKENVMSVVWSVKKSRQSTVESWSDVEFIDHLQDTFGWYLGRIRRVGKRVAYPLSLTRASIEHGQRALLVGNAAHTLHPIAGQGLNLTVRDIAEFSRIVRQNIQHIADPDVILKQYEMRRYRDQSKVIYATDMLNRVFSSDWLPHVAARQVAMHALSSAPWLKRQAMKHALGFVWR